MDLPHHVLRDADEVRRAFDLWSDDASRREYIAQIAFRLQLEYDGLTSPVPEQHYFPPLFRLCPNEVLVDCGAFDGDTIRAFLERQEEAFARVIAFEPDSLNWMRLQATLAVLPDRVRSRICCLPFALGSSRGFVRFDATGTDLSVAGAGTSTVECVTLDEVLAGAAPTLIKFDIEGAEPDALIGARETISVRGPVLAVSAYHRQSHLWEIPLAIDGIRAGYRYGLRAHGAEGWDVVCYAVPAERWEG
jgi:FkbM family methyltransferase